MRYGIRVIKSQRKVYLRVNNLSHSYGAIDDASSTNDLVKLSAWKALADADVVSGSVSNVDTVEYRTLDAPVDLSSDIDDKLIQSGLRKLTAEEKRALGV